MKCRMSLCLGIILFLVSNSFTDSLTLMSPKTNGKWWRILDHRCKRRFFKSPIMLYAHTDVTFNLIKLSGDIEENPGPFGIHSPDDNANDQEPSTSLAATGNDAYNLPPGYARCFCLKCDGQIRVLKTIRKHDGWKNNSFDTFPADGQQDLTSTSDTLFQSGASLSNDASVSFDIVDNTEMSNSSDENQIGSLIDQNDALNDSEEDNDPSEQIRVTNDSDNNEHIGDIHQLVDETSVNRHILRILESKIKYGWSREAALEQLLSLFNLIGDNNIPYKEWDDVLKFLRKIGYEDARCEKVCISQDHVLILDYKEPCHQCGKKYKDAHDYFILGLRLKSTFLNMNTCLKYMEHWKHKDEWFNVNETVWPKTETWHGNRFRELSYFWDENEEFQLPSLCPNCRDILSAEEINAGNEVIGGREIVCSECSSKVTVVPTFSKGNPLNQAFIFHEDGFNSFIRKTRGTAAISIASGCCTKVVRGETHSIYSFVPTCKLPEKLVHKFDAFLEPLISDITDLYINGLKITLDQDLKIGDSIIRKGIHTVRCIILLGTADLKAHAEMVLYAAGGKHGCRRCTVAGTYDNARRHYYYKGFRKRSRFPAEDRTPEKQMEDGLRCDKSLTEKGQKEIQLETGIRGVSILFKLYKLYKFDPIRDMVIDRMHLSFNMLKREFLDKMWSEMGTNSSKPVNERDPSEGGLLFHDEFQSALNMVEWTREQRASGSASVKCLTDKLGGWKSDQFLKFSLVAKAILAGRIPSKAYDCFVCCCDIAGMLYSKFLRNNGWSENHVKMLNNLLWTHAIKAEEFYGFSICTENLEYSVHIGTDIIRHSAPDNYSCDMYERVIRKLKEQKHNAKGLEKTYCERENLRLFLTDYQRMHGTLYHTVVEKYPYRFDINQDLDRPLYLNERSFEAAKKLLNDLKSKVGENNLLQEIIRTGVLLGSLKRKCLQDCQHYDIMQKLSPLSQYPVRVPKIARCCEALVKYDSNGNILKFSKGDICTIAGGPNLDEIWHLKIKVFILIGPFVGKYFVFVDGDYYIPAIDPVTRSVLYHSWTNSVQLVPRNYTRGRLQLSSQLQRQEILYPEPLREQNPSFYLAIDFDNKPDHSEIIVPVYPVINDCIAVRGRAQATWYGRVIQVYEDDKRVRVKWFKETRRGLLNALDQYDNVFFRSILRIVSIRRTNQGFSIQGQ